MIRIAHTSQLPPRDEGFRVLVTRKWPRGLDRKEIDLWAKDLGGTPELLKEFRRGKISFPSFEGRYRAETSDPGRRELVLDLQRREQKHKTLVLVCDGEDETTSVRAVLKGVLETSS